MANPLTGDFDAVLQVSGGSLNRLLASLHQNAFTDSSRPSFPHSIRMRMGDDHAFEGVRGLAEAQASVPLVTLVHGATDRFRLEVSVRAWFQPDPGTTPLPAYINGVVRAEYRLHDIDRSCPGWLKDAADYLWFRVVRDSVTFQGTAEDEVGLISVVQAGADPAAEEAANLAKVTRQIARLLAKRFEAVPHKVSKRFRHGSMRSLNVPGVGSALVVPLGLNGGDPVGNIASVNGVLLNGADIALAIRVEAIMALAQKMAKPFNGFSQSFHVHISTPSPFPDIDTDYDVGLHPPVITWQPQGSYALINIKVSGWANTGSIAPNATFDIDQNVSLNFDGGFWLEPGSWSYKVHVSGLYSGTVADAVGRAIKKIVPGIVQSACDGANPSLATLTETGDVVARLQSLDAAADVFLDTADFGNDGIVVRGRIRVAGRHRPVILQEKAATGDAHSALSSWIPGGRIDRIEWTWSWAGGDPGGAKVFTDRFLLRRPAAKSSRWGIATGMSQPLPGLDGWGVVCLKLTGVTIDPITGNFTTVVTQSVCKRFGFLLATVADINKANKAAQALLLRDMPDLVQDVPPPRWQERGLVAVGRNPALADRAANTLVLLADEDWEREIGEALAQGLGACRRYDAGLSVLVLFKEGVLDARGPDLVRAVERALRDHGILGHVNEDVGGRWARRLDLEARQGGAGWALLTPEGALPWRHSGRLAPEALGQALDRHLRRTPDVQPAAYVPPLQVGQAISAASLTQSIGDLIDSIETQCPPIPFGRMVTGDTVIAFANKHSDASLDHIQAMARTQSGATVIAVVEGATAREIEAWQRQHGTELVAIADPQGAIGSRFGIDVWPTTVTVTRDGLVSDIAVGLHRHDRHDEGQAGGASAD